MALLLNQGLSEPQSTVDTWSFFSKIAMLGHNTVYPRPSMIITTTTKFQHYKFAR